LVLFLFRERGFCQPAPNSSGRRRSPSKAAPSDPVPPLNPPGRRRLTAAELSSTFTLESQKEVKMQPITGSKPADKTRSQTARFGLESPRIGSN